MANPRRGLLVVSPDGYETRTLDACTIFVENTITNINPVRWSVSGWSLDGDGDGMGIDDLDYGPWESSLKNALGYDSAVHDVQYLNPVRSGENWTTMGTGLSPEEEWKSAIERQASSRPRNFTLRFKIVPKGSGPGIGGVASGSGKRRDDQSDPAKRLLDLKGGGDENDDAFDNEDIGAEDEILEQEALLNSL